MLLLNRPQQFTKWQLCLYRCFSITKTHPTLLKKLSNCQLKPERLISDMIGVDVEGSTTFDVNTAMIHAFDEL
jgi:hypothetical protein